MLIVLQVFLALLGFQTVFAPAKITPTVLVAQLQFLVRGTLLALANVPVNGKQILLPPLLSALSATQQNTILKLAQRVALD